MNFGFYRVASIVPKLYLANPFKNAKEMLELLKRAFKNRASIALFPEMGITGYSVGDLFFQDELYTSQNNSIKWLLKHSKSIDTIAVIGAMVRVSNRLFNCALVIQRGEILGLIPKSYIPNKREFYEKRYFNSSFDTDLKEIEFLGKSLPFGTDLIFRDNSILKFGVELCEDLWAITPPSNALASAGANLILNLSASNELVAKADYRSELVRTQSARLICAYVYSSSGVGESTTDTLFGGDSIIAEYGSILARGKRFLDESQIIYADIDLDKLNGLRLAEGSYIDSKAVGVREITVSNLPTLKEIKRVINPYPFIPSNKRERAKHSEEIIQIQSHALIRRLKSARAKRAIIGISGGLDSTLALLSTYRAFKIDSREPKDILAITMPGFGTTNRTYNNALNLSKALGVTLKEIDIKPLALEEFKLLEHDLNICDLTYENTQARARTQILMNLANKEGGIVIGTGDLSEIALGWSTYNGDHMSMYAINSGIPKTLIKYLIEYYASIYKELSPILEDILNTPVSPELLPHKDGEITQKTEELIGPYELHDFFLYHFLKYGAKPSKICFLASLAFGGKYSKDEIKRWLELFLRRFFTQQFKRSCMPDGPKVGTISLSPRADWRMPSDSLVDSWIDELKGAKC